MADNEEEEDIDKSNEENTILFKDNASILEDSVPLIEEDPKLLEISTGMKAILISREINYLKNIMFFFS